MSERHQHRLIPALRFRWLTPAYDRVVQLTTRESRFKPALLSQLQLRDGQNVLDLGCSTATLTLMVKRRFLTVFGNVALYRARKPLERAV